MMENVPLDLLYPVLDHLDRRDLVNTALVSSKFNCVTTPLLYRTISSHTEEKVRIYPISFPVFWTPSPYRFSSILVLRYFDDRN